MPNNPYAAPAAALDDASAAAGAIYSPNQIAAGTLLGGPIAAIFFLRANFNQLNAFEAARSTLVWGSAIVMALFALAFVLPDDFPGLPFSVAAAFGARATAEKLQLTKEAIASSATHRFQSNWKVFGVGLLSIAISVAVVLGVLFALSALVLVSL